jgi:hypothetical protein
MPSLLHLRLPGLGLVRRDAGELAVRAAVGEAEALASSCAVAAIARRLVVSEAAAGKHVGNLLYKLRLPQTDDTNRRVLAVLAYLRSNTTPE